MPNDVDIGRFTGYVSAQAYASFCTALFCIAVCSKMIRPVLRYTTAVALAVAVVLDGSRLWMSALCVATITALLASRTRAWTKTLSVSAVVLIVAGVTASSDLTINLLTKAAASNRIAAFIEKVYEGDTQDRALGTYNLRRRIDDRGIEMIQASSALEILLGHGTSNGALITWSVIPTATDPNRAVHNEWLRIAYEWGVIGMATWILFLCAVAIYAIDASKKDRGGYAQPLIAYLPALMIGLSGENILAGAGNAANLGLILVIAFAGIPYHEARRYALFREFVARHYRTFGTFYARRPGIASY